MKVATLLDPFVIAIVDDDEDIREALSDLVSSMGLRAEAYGSAEDFLASASGKTHCVITDIRMPGMNGLELLKLLNASGSLVPVIILTSMTDPSTRSRALAMGACSFLTKPVSDQVLVDSLHLALPDWTPN